MKYKYILFDLDGTLTDSQEGITKSVQHALKYFDIIEEDLSKLICFIGPPLKDMFCEKYGFSEEVALMAIERYRERFSELGWAENALYPGVKETLEKLKAKGLILAIASSKPEFFVNKIVEHFGIKDYFNAIVGSELDGTRINKCEVVEEAIRRLGLTSEDRQLSVLVGDKIHDVEGAHSSGIHCIGASYGFGTDEELQEAEYVINSIEELPLILA
ncbi:HAD hydrolase-like protein [Alloiococcus sp. CFN-8]|uniref:HAD hydrolase-like protein n=1 Tax=Alloiococcus sp. CFN-8 TaxID=3416081 RepID=UPI003CE6EED7